ncbi:MAG: hypothetical protein HKN30_13005 [Sulfitobacter sp.]|nr:hypothetical protein [Sulfitobacter sp.]
MNRLIPQNRYHWEGATGLAAATLLSAEHTPQGALVPDTAQDCDQVAVVYNKGDTPPKITVEETDGPVQTVRANGIAVAIVARAFGPAISPDDVLLVERCV